MGEKPRFFGKNLRFYYIFLFVICNGFIWTKGDVNFRINQYSGFLKWLEIVDNYHQFVTHFQEAIGDSGIVSV